MKTRIFLLQMKKF